MRNRQAGPLIQRSTAIKLRATATALFGALPLHSLTSNAPAPPTDPCSSQQCTTAPAAPAVPSAQAVRHWPRRGRQCRSPGLKELDGRAFSLLGACLLEHRRHSRRHCAPLPQCAAVVGSASDAGRVKKRKKKRERKAVGLGAGRPGGGALACVARATAPLSPVTPALLPQPVRRSPVSALQSQITVIFL